jgi:hypothetical protein
VTIQTRVETVIEARDAGATATLKKVEAGALAAEKANTLLTNALKGAAAFFAAKFSIGFVASIVKAGAELSRMSRGLGVAVEDLSRLRFAFAAAGVGADKLRDVLETLEKKRAAALRGPGEASRGFDALGIDFEELQSLNAAQLLDEIADGLGKFATQQQKVAALTPLFENNLSSMVDMLGEGRDSFRAATMEADKFGATINANVAAQLEKAEKNFRKLSASVDAVATSLGQSVFGALFGGPADPNADLAGMSADAQRLIVTMRALQDGTANLRTNLQGLLAAELSLTEIQNLSTLSIERKSAALQVLAKRLADTILAEQKAKAAAASQPSGPLGPAFGPEAQALNREAEGEAERNSRFQPPTDNSPMARSLSEPGFIDGLTASWDRLVDTMGTANAVGQQFGNLVGGAISGVSDILVDMIATGKSSSEMWKKLGASVASELAKIAIQYAIIGAIKGASGISFAHGGVGGGDGHDEPTRIHKFAHGGMAGGIAGGRSIAVYGETSRREAFVPLQDGRNIPVRIEGSGGSSVMSVYYISAIDTQSMANALQRHGAIYRGAMRDGLSGNGGDRRIAKRAVR